MPKCHTKPQAGIGIPCKTPMGTRTYPDTAQKKVGPGGKGTDAPRDLALNTICNLFWPIAAVNWEVMGQC